MATSTVTVGLTKKKFNKVKYKYPIMNFTLLSFLDSHFVKNNPRTYATHFYPFRETIKKGVFENVRILMVSWWQ